MGTYVKKLAKVTFSVHHNPICLKPYQVRLIGKFTGSLDNLQNSSTRDILGYGKTLEEAAKNAWTERYGKK